MTVEPQLPLVQVVDLRFKALEGLVEMASGSQKAQVYPSYGCGIANYVQIQVRRSYRGNEQGGTGCTSAQLHIVRKQRIEQVYAEPFHIHPQTVPTVPVDAAVDADALVSVAETESVYAYVSVCYGQFRFVDIPVR